MAFGAMIDTLGVRRAPAGGLLGMLIAIDLALIGFHVSMVVFGRPGGMMSDLGADGSYSEFLQYTKNLWAIMLLILLATQRRTGVFVAWAIVCAYFLLDDALLLHERAGWAFRDMIPGQPSWAVHVGELALVAVVGLVLLVIVAITHARAPREDRAVSVVLMILFGALVFFGIVLDGVHHLLFPGPELRLPFTVVEDGGELIVLSLVVAFVFAVALCGHQPKSRVTSVAEVELIER